MDKSPDRYKCPLFGGLVEHKTSNRSLSDCAQKCPMYNLVTSTWGTDTIFNTSEIEQSKC